MATNEFHVRASLVETIEASSAVTSLAGSSQPVRLWGDLGTASRPVIALRIGYGRFLAGGCDPMNWPVTLDVFVDSDSTGRASAIADALETVITYSNLASTARTYPVDVAPYKRARFPQSELDEGRGRLTLEYDFRHHR
jgi:hypothetical protein